MSNNKISFLRIRNLPPAYYSFTFFFFNIVCFFRVTCFSVCANHLTFCSLLIYFWFWLEAPLKPSHLSKLCTGCISTIKPRLLLPFLQNELPVDELFSILCVISVPFTSSYSCSSLVSPDVVTPAMLGGDLTPAQHPSGTDTVLSTWCEIGLNLTASL